MSVLESDKVYAHSRKGVPPDGWHLLEDHLNEVAKMAGMFASSFGAEEWGRIIGLLHDIGKSNPEFQSYLRHQNGYEAQFESLPGKIDHSSVGAWLATSSADPRTFSEHVARILTFCIAGHHTGLPDGSHLTERLETCNPMQIDNTDSWKKQLSDLKLPDAIKPASTQNQTAFRISMFIRMLYSALVDADFLDTARFIQPEREENRISEHRSIHELTELLDKHIESLSKTQASNVVSEARAMVLEQCRKAANIRPGLFSLTVPTGGGKTLSSMAFALRHAEINSMDRIIYAIPYTSIIEQNAAVLRDALGPDAILEHHSAIDTDQESISNYLAAENWDSRIVVATNVQFFESLFAFRNSRCRKLHNIANSVIILDEVQALPVPFLLPCLFALRELVATYHCSVVLCTATQPALEKRDLFPEGLEDVYHIIPDEERLFHDLMRVHTTYAGPVSDEELISRLIERKQVLCVVNTRRHASTLAKRIQDMDGTFHLSALMCHAHRTEVLNEIRSRLKDGRTCRVISTQLIEAGVDIDFPFVYRALAGLDSIAQAAGRCNRNGLLHEYGNVVVFEAEQPPPRGAIGNAAGVTKQILHQNNQHDDDILRTELVNQYFRLYVWLQGDGIDQHGIVSDLREGYMASVLSFPFRAIGEKFRFINNEAHSIIIPWGDNGNAFVEEMQSSFSIPHHAHRRAQRYSIQVYEHEWRRLQELAAIETLHENFHILSQSRMSLYDKLMGLNIGEDEANDPEQYYV